MGGGCLRHFIVRFRLDGMDQIGKLDRVLNEKHRNVVADQIVVAFFRIKLDREAAHVAGKIGGATRSDHGREAHEDRRLDRRILEKFALV